MKKSLLIVSLFVSLFLFGCSEEKKTEGILNYTKEISWSSVQRIITEEKKYVEEKSKNNNFEKENLLTSKEETDIEVKVAYIDPLWEEKQETFIEKVFTKDWERFWEFDFVQEVKNPWGLPNFINENSKKRIIKINIGWYFYKCDNMISVEWNYYSWTNISFEDRYSEKHTYNNILPISWDFETIIDEKQVFFIVERNWNVERISELCLP